MKQRNTIYVRVLLVVLAIVILLVFSDRGGRPTHHDTWLPSSYNPVGAGSMPLFQTLQQLNWPVERWREPLSRLNSLGTGNVLITQDQPANEPYPERDWIWSFDGAHLRPIANYSANDAAQIIAVPW